MRPIIRTTLALTAAAVLGVPTAAAHADQPTVTTFDYTDGFTAAPGDLCDFAVDFTFHDVGSSSVTSTGQGSIQVDHVTETDTMSANGRSITGEPYSYTVQLRVGDTATVHTAGVTWSFLLPDGTRVHAAGYSNFTVESARGKQVDLGPVCAYLAS
jgi:hypothetical protein